MRRFEITLADSDRELYESLELRVAQHPSESTRYLVCRVIARVLLHAEGVDFSKGGLSDEDEPALSQRDLRGDRLAWIEIGRPSADRLHKAMKASPRVVVYGWKLDGIVDEIRDRKVYERERLELWAIDGAWLDGVAATLDRVNRWDVAVTGGTIYLTIGEALHETTPERVTV